MKRPLLWTAFVADGSAWKQALEPVPSELCGEAQPPNATTPTASPTPAARAFDEILM
jgi:hypothetical protein